MQSFDTLEAYWQDICNIPRLSEVEEAALATQIQGGSDRAVDKLVTANLRYVVSVARQMSEKGVAMEDLISEGNIALIGAARKWDPEKNPSFIGYAMYDVKKTMEEALPEQGEAMTMPKHDNKAGLGLRNFSTDVPVHPGQTNTLGDLLRAGKPDTDDPAELQEISYALTLAMRILNERERQIIAAFYGIKDEAVTMAEIGQQMNLKRERVRQIRKTAERKMRRYLKAASM